MPATPVFTSEENFITTSLNQMKNIIMLSSHPLLIIPVNVPYY